MLDPILDSLGLEIGRLHSDSPPSTDFPKLKEQIVLTFEMPRFLTYLVLVKTQTHFLWFGVDFLSFCPFLQITRSESFLNGGILF